LESKIERAYIGDEHVVEEKISRKDAELEPTPLSVLVENLGTSAVVFGYVLGIYFLFVMAWTMRRKKS